MGAQVLDPSKTNTDPIETPEVDGLSHDVHIPWLPPKEDPLRYGKSLQNLAWEVIDFWEWVRPQREEKAAREMLLHRVSSAAKSIWPQSKVRSHSISFQLELRLAKCPRFPLQAVHLQMTCDLSYPPPHAIMSGDGIRLLDSSEDQLASVTGGLRYFTTVIYVVTFFVAAQDFAPKFALLGTNRRMSSRSS
jgi:hypothetical protein